MDCSVFFFFQAEDGIRDLVRSRGLGDVYKRQACGRGSAKVCVARICARSPSCGMMGGLPWMSAPEPKSARLTAWVNIASPSTCLLYTSDAADERSSVDLGGRRIIKKKKKAALIRRTDVYDIQHENR